MAPSSASSPSCSPTFTFYSFPLLNLLTFLLLLLLIFLHLLLSFSSAFLPRSVYQLTHLCLHCLSRRQWVKELMRSTYSPLMQWRQFGTEKEVACCCISGLKRYIRILSYSISLYVILQLSFMSGFIHFIKYAARYITKSRKAHSVHISVKRHIVYCMSESHLPICWWNGYSVNILRDLKKVWAKEVAPILQRSTAYFKKRWLSNRFKVSSPEESHHGM